MVGGDAGRDGSKDLMETYVKGTGDSGYICLDIHGSRKTVDNLEFSIDIDSVIWVTDKLKICGSINLQLLPYKGDTAPIKKHNHAYVKLY